MKAEIKGMELNDDGKFWNLVNHIGDEEESLFFTSRTPLDKVRHYIQMHIDENNPILGAYVNEELIGWIDFNIGAFEEIRHMATIAMGISKEFRYKGIGQQLMINAIRQAKELKIEKIELEVFSNNHPAYSMYKNWDLRKKVFGKTRESIKTNTLILSGWQFLSNYVLVAFGNWKGRSTRIRAGAPWENSFWINFSFWGDFE